MAVFYCSNCTDREKVKSNYPFPSIVKKKKAWNFRKWEGKSDYSNFQERFNWEKARKNKNESNVFCLPFINFFIQSWQYQIWKANTYSIQLTVIELGPPVSESSTRFSKFYDTTDSEHKSHKTRIENWLSKGLELGFPWLKTYCYNHYTLFNSMMGSIKLLYTHPQSLGTILETFHFP